MKKIHTESITAKDRKVVYELLLMDDLIKLFKLTKKEAAIIKMTWKENKDFKEIADEFNSDEDTIKQKYVKAIKRFKDNMVNTSVQFQKINGLKEENLKLHKIIRIYEQKFGVLEIEEKEILNPLYKISIDSILMPVRVFKVLKSKRINTIGDIMEYSKMDYLSWENFARKSLYDLENLLEKEFGLYLKS